MPKPERASPEMAREIFAHILAWLDAVTPEVERYWRDGWMPVVVLLPHRDAIDLLKELGWKGSRTCFGVRRDALNPFLRHPSEQQWLLRPTTGQVRAFMFVQLGTFLLVKDPGKPWSVEPGTLDGELVS